MLLYDINVDRDSNPKRQTLREQGAESCGSSYEDGRAAEGCNLPAARLFMFKGGQREVEPLAAANSRSRFLPQQKSQ